MPMFAWLSEFRRSSRGTAAVEFAARSDIPFDAITQQKINNLVRTGGISGDAPLLAKQAASTGAAAGAAAGEE